MRRMLVYLLFAECKGTKGRAFETVTADRDCRTRKTSNGGGRATRGEWKAVRGLRIKPAGLSCGRQRAGIPPRPANQGVHMLQLFQKFIEESPWDDELNIIFDWMGWGSVVIIVLLLAFIVPKLKILWG